MLAFFEAAGCRGAVVAGTTGEGPSLSAAEKRDLIRAAVPLRGRLELLLGVATPSLDEAKWLCRQAEAAGASGVLLMPPFYFRKVSGQAVGDWLLAVLDASPLPVVVYNFPQMTGIELPASLVGLLGGHPRFAGIKDSSGDRGNLKPYRDALGPDMVLYVGDETLLAEALAEGWSGSISGAANVVPHWLSQIVREWFSGERESAEAKFEVLRPVVECVRRHPQPATHKGVLVSLGLQDSNAVRLPLEPAGSDSIDEVIGILQSRLGMAEGRLGLPRS